MKEKEKPSMIFKRLLIYLYKGEFLKELKFDGLEFTPCTKLVRQLFQTLVSQENTIDRTTQVVRM